MQNLINNLKKYNNVKLSVRDIESLREYFLKEIICLMENNFKEGGLSIFDGDVKHNNKNLMFFDEYRSFIDVFEKVIKDCEQTDIEVTKFGDHSGLFQYLLEQLKKLKY